MPADKWRDPGVPERQTRMPTEPPPRFAIPETENPVSIERVLVIAILVILLLALLAYLL